MGYNAIFLQLFAELANKLTPDVWGGGGRAITILIQLNSNVLLNIILDIEQTGKRLASRTPFTNGLIDVYTCTRSLNCTLM